MCGIVGYVGNNDALGPVLDGLEALEYRGYDSAGVAIMYDGNISCTKQIGGVANVEKLLKNEGKSTTAIGHTRWATHGEPSVANAHPHYNSAKTIFIVHNGIIENHQELRDKLTAKGYTFSTETDTEVIPHLIDYHLKKNEFI